MRQKPAPKNFAERIVQALQPHVGEIFIATDLPQARDAGADFYLVLDGWLGTASGWNTWYRATGGAYLLDGSLRQAFSVQGEAKVKLESVPLA